MKKTNIRNLSFLIIPTVIFILCFFLFFTSHAEANSGDLSHMTGYESVLIKDGDTLTSIAAQYASQYSYYSAEEYLDSIVLLNDLSSEYIAAGNFLLLPDFI